MNSDFPYRWSPVSLTLNILRYLFLLLYLIRIPKHNDTPHLKPPKSQNRRAAIEWPAIKLLGGGGVHWFCLGSSHKTLSTKASHCKTFGWLFWGLTALWDNISVYIEPSPKGRETEKRKDRWESKQPPPAPTASAVGPCPTIIQIVGRPGTGSLPRAIAPPDPPPPTAKQEQRLHLLRIWK